MFLQIKQQVKHMGKLASPAIIREFWGQIQCFYHICIKLVLKSNSEMISPIIFYNGLNFYMSIFNISRLYFHRMLFTLYRTT